MRLKVYAKGTGDTPDRHLGYTPSKKHNSIKVPSGVWVVRPQGPLAGAQIHHLADVLIDQKVPGVDLSNRWDITDETLAILARCDHLQYLNVSHTKVTDTGLEALTQLPALKALTISQNITDKGASHLSALVRLEELDLDGARITDEGMAPLKKLSRLRSLVLSNTQVTDAGLIPLLGHDRLETLVLSRGISDGGVKTLVNLKGLTSLDGSATRITDGGWKRFGSMHQLKVLYLNPEAGDAALQALAEIKGLEILDLTGTRVTDAGMAFLAGLTQLKEVALTQTVVSDTGLAQLAKSRSLRVLELSNTRVSPTGMALVAKNHPKLEAISVSWPRLSSRELESLASLQRLETVLLNGSPLPGSVTRHLQAMAKLQKDPPRAPKVPPAPSAAVQRTASSRNSQFPRRAAPALPASGDRFPGLTSVSPQRASLEMLYETPKGTLALPVKGSPASIPVLSNVTPASLSGLRRVRQVEGEGGSLADLQMPMGRKIVSENYTPENSLGEFTINSQPEKKH